CLRVLLFSFFFSSRRRHTRWPRDWSSDVCSSDLLRTWLSPGGRYTSTVDGVGARCGDGVHLTPAGGELVANQLFPLITSVARDQIGRASCRESGDVGGWGEGKKKKVGEVERRDED